ncbi:type I-F CRISPR-associated protein Csy3 [Microbulbifer sp.]|uniref:type I-F CRISPR-associated protein Csy3 n=1 Tax=Microbulbifer sp. TaxID=1908541 RepID=UPI00258424C2|nr:type I-F CRISPR-associated protein Csy3 [Microbulbifer sp.]
MTNKTTLKTASVLAFERKLDPSDALFFSGDWNKREKADHWDPTSIREKSIRGTISNRLNAKNQDPAKLDAAIEKPNLQTVDVATLPNTCDTLMVRFTLRVLGGAGLPSACNNADYQAKLQSVVKGYVEDNGFSELAHRYAVNLANGRFLWRNRIGAEEVEVVIRKLERGQEAQKWIFDSLSLSLRHFDCPESNQEQLAELAEQLELGLLGERHTLFEITAFVRAGAGQEVFPSQELILDKGKSTKSRTLYDVKGVAAIHSQKIGNALRTIDTWYPQDGEQDFGPIAVEPYGSVTTQGSAFRQPKEKVDFYNLLDNWVLKDQKPALDNQHFVMATLVRGGVFGEADK